jgi:hypothetical protein
MESKVLVGTFEVLKEFTPIEGVTFIGLGHKARHGKDTFAASLHSLYPYQIHRVAFADALKMYCRLNHGMTKKDSPLLQRVGNEMRQKDPYFWVRCVYWAIDELRPKYALITDVRYQNEAEWIKAMGGIVIKVERRNPDGSLFVDPSRPADHVSEIDLDRYQFDHVVVNDGQLSDLSYKAQELFQELYG